MNWLDPLFLCSGATGVSLIIIFLIARRYPPKEINELYGYRSKRSKSSQEAWDFAQKYSNDLVLWIGAYNCLIAIPGLFLGLEPIAGLILSLAFMTLSFVYLYRKTEQELKKRFGE